MEENETEAQPFRIYEIISGDVKSPEKLELSYIKSFASSGKAAQYLRSKDFLAEHGKDGKIGQFVVVSEHQHYEVRPITVFLVQPISKAPNN